MNGSIYIRRGIAILLPVLFLLAGARLAAGTPPADAKSQNADAAFIDAFIECRRAEAKAEFLREETDRLGSAPLAMPPVVKTLADIHDADATQSLAEMLYANHRPILTALEKADGEIGANERKLRDSWTALRGKLSADQAELYEGRADRQIAGQLAFLLNVDNRWFWLFGLIAVAVLAGIVLHDRRHELRRQLNGGKARAMGMARVIYVLLFLMATVTIGIFVSGDWIYQSLLTFGAGNIASPQKENEAKLQDIKQQLTVARQAEKDARQKCLDARKNATEWLSKLPGSNPKKDLLAIRTAARDSMESIAVELKVQDAIAKQMKADADELAKIDAELGENTKEVEQNYHKRQWIRRGLGVGLLGLVALGGGMFQLSVRRRREKVRNTCPQCLGEGTFELLENGPIPGMMQCKSLMSEHPNYEECAFTMPEQYLDMPKICFPTLGMPSSGKTHWLAMTYRELNRNNFQDTIQFSQIRSPAAEQMAQRVNDILELRIKTEATPDDGIPCPLVFNFDDLDPLGKSSILVNIFDYSGEVVRRMTLEDRQRRRALDGDGFLFFLDPTRSSEDQANILANFRNDLCLIKKVKPNTQLHIPVALCVSKLDLLFKNPYTQRGNNGAIDDFYRGLAEVGWDSTLSAIGARSKLVAELRDTVWPGWPVERTLSKMFGGRCMFFPLTPVGLNGVGIEDLRERVISPLGLLDPLLWLLHMNGYPVFK